jgi:basic amino acid/polyamine antiporter, APA family
MATTETPATTTSQRVFARDATGLVREVSWRDAAAYNMIWASIPLAVALLLSLGPAFYTGGNLYLAVLFAFILTAPMGLLYAMFSSAIPRSGGDYTWISRSLSPPLGFMSNLSWNFWVAFFIGTYAVYTASYGISPLLRLWAARLNDPGLISTINWFNSRSGVLTIGLVIVVLSGVFLSFGRGLGTFARVQRWAFVVWFVGTIIIPMIVMFVTSKAAVESRLNHYVHALGGPGGAVGKLVTAGAYHAPPFSFLHSLTMVTLPFYTMAFLFASVYFGGEIKRGKRSNLLSIPGAHFISAICILLLTVAFLSTVGMPLLADMGVVTPSKYGLTFAPLYTELAGLVSGNIIVATIIMVGMIVMLIIFVPQTMLMLSRNIFAWSFDRLLPDKLGEVNPRTHSPIYAVGVVTVIGIASVFILAFNSGLTFLVGLLGLTFTYLAVGVAGIVFPYRRKDVFEASPYNQRFHGVPVMSIVSAVALVAMLGCSLILVLDSNSGTNWDINTNRVVLGICVFFVGLPIYYAIRGIQRRRGVNIDLAYKEVPPE